MAKPRRKNFGKLNHCACYDISSERIEECVRMGAGSVVAVFAMNRCKLKCGDCVPAIRKEIKRQENEKSYETETMENANGTPCGRRHGQGKIGSLSR